jgi:hypothetical protein
MKQFFLTMTGSLVLLAACNDSATSTNETKDSSATTTTTTTAPATSNVVSKTGLTLSASNEVPANKSTASGTADVKYDKDSHMLTFTVNYTGLTDKPTMAHIHGTAAKGVNAGVKQDLTGVLVKETKGSFTDSVKVDGSTIKEDSLLTGFYYINIHTPKNPGGEIRTQIEF